MLAALLSFILVSATSFGFTWSYSADDVNNRVQDAIDSLSAGDGQIEADSATVTAFKATSGTIDTLDSTSFSATSATLGGVSQAELNTLDSSLTNNSKVFTVFRVALPSSLAQGTTYISEALPQNFIINSGFVRVTTPPTSTNSGSATLSVGILSATDLVAAGTGGITNAVWGAGSAINVEMVPAIETPSTYIVCTGTANRVRFVASMAITQIVGTVYITGFKAQ
jgi:hypothetical protein